MEWKKSENIREEKSKMDIKVCQNFAKFKKKHEKVISFFWKKMNCVEISLSKFSIKKFLSLYSPNFYYTKK